VTDREKLIEAMVKAIADRSYPAHVEHRALATAALSAIEAMGAVVVPVLSTRDMNNAGAYVEYHKGGHSDMIYEAMLAASPFAKETTDE
jgi:hypothetical protein